MLIELPEIFMLRPDALKNWMTWWSWDVEIMQIEHSGHLDDFISPK